MFWGVSSGPSASLFGGVSVGFVIVWWYAPVVRDLGHRLLVDETRRVAVPIGDRSIPDNRRPTSARGCCATFVLDGMSSDLGSCGNDGGGYEMGEAVGADSGSDVRIGFDGSFSTIAALFSAESLQCVVLRAGSGYGSHRSGVEGFAACVAGHLRCGGASAASVLDE
jgi:hypothetical protein